MDIFLLILRLTLAAVFGIAAFAKLFDQAGTEKAFAGFGVPEFARKPLSKLLPAAELGIAIALLFVSSSWIGSIGAGMLLIIFLGGMFYQIAKGNAPDCHCFGQLHSEPVGLISVARNLVLLAMAGFLIGQGMSYQGLSLVNSSQEIMQVIIGLATIALLGAIVFMLKRISDQQIELVRRIEMMDLVREEGSSVQRDGVVHPHEGLPIGSKFPDFDLPGVNGDRVTLEIIKSAGKPSVFFFISPSCTPCKALVPEFEQWQTELKDKVNLVFVSSGSAEENEEKFGENIKRQLLIQKKRELAELSRAKWTPTAIFVDRHGRVAGHAAAGDIAIRDLVEKLKSQDLGKEHVYFPANNGNEHRIMVGHEIPEFSLHDLTGQPIGANSLKGKKTLVAFWGLDCGHCKQMLDDLRKWDRSRSNGDPAMVVFSDGDISANAALDFRSPTIIDPGHKVSEKFGMFGTPSAVLVNEDGIIISETAMGAADIWALIGRHN